MQIDIVIDGVSEITQLTRTGIAKDEVLAQACIALAHIKILISNTVNGLLTSNLHARPIAIQIIDITPHVEGQCIPTGLIINEYGKSVVLYRGFRRDFLDTVSGNAQIDVAINGKVEILQLSTCTTIIEDEVLVQTGVLLTEVEILPGDSIVVPRTGHLHAGPVAVQVVDVTPHVEGQYIPTCLVVYVNAETIVLRLGGLAAFPVVSLPTLSPDIGKGSHTGIVIMNSFFAIDGIFLTLCL